MNPFEEMPLEPNGVPRGRAMIERAQWAARAFASYDITAVRRIARAAAEAGAGLADELAAATVEETGFGVAEHKTLKNLGCSRGIWETYGAQDFVSPVVENDAKIVRVPRPAGVVLALTPSTNPVATAYFNVMLALLTRNAMIISPHPYAKGVSARAVAVMADAAVAAGAPDGCVQVVEEPSVPLVNALMTNERVALIVATGGSAMVRAAYSSANPALGVGPGNVPVMVDETADPVQAARLIVDSKAFDNSVLCTSESVLITTDAASERLLNALARAGGYLASAEEVAKLRKLVFPGGRLATELIGRSATAIAQAADIKVPSGTKVLVTPFELVVPEEVLAHEKLLPVLGLVRVPTLARGVETARAVLRISGEGHSAAIHSNDPHHVLAYSAGVRVNRVSVNVGNSLGGSGFHTNLAPTMTIGTGFFGRSSLAENLAPQHLIQHTQIAYNSDQPAPMDAYHSLDPWLAPTGPVPSYPVASNLLERPMSASASVSAGPSTVGQEPTTQVLREQIRRMVIEELQAMVKD